MEEQNALFKRFIRNECTRQEIEDLLSGFSKAGNETALRQMILEALKNEEGNMPQAYPNLEEKEQVIYAALIPYLRERRTVRLWPRIAAAASILFILSAGGYFILHRQKQAQTAQIYKNDIAPGGNKAILTLANGIQVNMTNAQNGRIASQAGAVIQKTTAGTIVYQNDLASAPATEQLNTIRTPNGGKWNLILADGTKVWLNAASSITYPAKFIGRERKVSITGEAYFEVVHNDAHPFQVEFNGQTVQDIGTHFNINTYADEPVSKTTLLEGSIKINGQLLKPGQVAIIGNNKLSIATADEEEAMAWKSGNIISRDEPLTGIMRKVARQYDVDIVYKDDVSEISMGCAVTTTKKVSTVLNYIKKIEKQLDFTINGRTITVFKK